MFGSVYGKDENYYPKVLSEKYNFNNEIKIYFDDSYNADYDEESFEDSDYSDEKFPTKIIQMKKIKCINSFLQKTSNLISIHPEILENFFIEM